MVTLYLELFLPSIKHQDLYEFNYDFLNEDKYLYQRSNLNPKFVSYFFDCEMYAFVAPDAFEMKINKTND